MHHLYRCLLQSETKLYSRLHPTPASRSDLTLGQTLLCLNLALTNPHFKSIKDHLLRPLTSEDTAGRALKSRSLKGSFHTVRGVKGFTIFPMLHTAVRGSSEGLTKSKSCFKQLSSFSHKMLRKRKQWIMILIPFINKDWYINFLFMSFKYYAFYQKQEKANQKRT